MDLLADVAPDRAAILLSTHEQLMQFFSRPEMLRALSKIWSHSMPRWVTVVPYESEEERSERLTARSRLTHAAVIGRDPTAIARLRAQQDLPLLGEFAVCAYVEEPGADELSNVVCGFSLRLLVCKVDALDVYDRYNNDEQ